MQHQTPTRNKPASLGMMWLLLMAGIGGAYLLLPLQTAHAATPVVSLWTITSGVKTPATSGEVASTLVITGSGFGPGKAITITSPVGSTNVPWLRQQPCTILNGGEGTVDSLVAEGCLITAASGDFQVSVAIPALPGGQETIAVSDGSAMVSSTFIITPSVVVAFAGNNFGFPEESINPSIAVAGFGSGESVTVATMMWTKASFSCTTGSLGSCAMSAATSVADTTGGSKTITATGAASGLVATTTYTINPWAAFYDSVAGRTSFSFIGTAPTALFVEAHGLSAGTIAANSITIGGVSTAHAAVTIGSNGGFGGRGGQLVISPTANVPFGSISVVIKGTTFRYASGNIALGAGVWGGALISSTLGSVTSTAVVVTDKSSYMPGTGFAASTTSPVPAQDQVGLFGYGFIPAGGAITISNGGSFLGTVTYNTGAVGACNNTCDANGAVFATAALGDTPWSSASSPTVAAEYTAITIQAPSSPANILSPSFSITPWIQSPASTKVDYTTSAETVTAHGFSNTETLSLRIGGSHMVSGGACITAASGMCTTTPGQVPDIAGGAQTILVAGALSGLLATQSVNYYPTADFDSGQTLSVNIGGPGQVTTVRTGNGYGIHGLAANTSYNVVWDAVSGSITVGTFTSTVTGGIPVPGVQFVIPSGPAGIHILDIQTSSGASVLYAGQVFNEVTPTEAPFSGTYTTAFGDMLFAEVAIDSTTTSISCSPAILSVGSTSTCTATVTDTSSGTPTTPSGMVTFSASKAGSFSSTTCNLSGSGAKATCAVTFMPTRVGLYQIVAAYAGDASHARSSAHRFLLAKS